MVMKWPVLPVSAMQEAEVNMVNGGGAIVVGGEETGALVVALAETSSVMMVCGLVGALCTGNDRLGSVSPLA